MWRVQRPDCWGMSVAWVPWADFSPPDCFPIPCSHPITGGRQGIGGRLARRLALRQSWLAVYAGGLASEAYAKPVLYAAQGKVYEGAALTAWQYLGANATIAFNTSFAVAKIHGASTHDAWQGAWRAAAYSVPFTLLDVAAVNMRADQIISSKSDPRGFNASKVSAGYRGDSFGLAGCRFPCENSLLGGVQGKNPGNLFGIEYPPGGIGDFIAEAGAGPHDFLSQWQYDALGNTKPFFQSGIGNALGWVGSAALLPVSVPISAGSVLSPYSGVLYSNRYIDYGP